MSFAGLASSTTSSTPTAMITATTATAMSIASAPGTRALRRPQPGPPRRFPVCAIDTQPYPPAWWSRVDSSRTSASVGSAPKPVRLRVAPACSRGRGSVPARVRHDEVERPVNALAQLRHLRRHSSEGHLGPRKSIGKCHSSARRGGSAGGWASAPRPRSGSAAPARAGARTRRPTARRAARGPRRAAAPARAGRPESPNGRELAVAVAADADAEHEPAAAEAVERDRLARELRGSGAAASGSRARRCARARSRRRSPSSRSTGRRARGCPRRRGGPRRRSRPSPAPRRRRRAARAGARRRAPRRGRRRSRAGQPRGDGSGWSARSA